MIYLSTEVTIGDSYVNENVYFAYQECDKLFGGDSIIKELRNRPNGIPIRMSQTFDLDEPWGDDRLEEHMEKTFTYFNDKFEEIIFKNLPRV